MTAYVNSDIARIANCHRVNAPGMGSLFTTVNVTADDCGKTSNNGRLGLFAHRVHRLASVAPRINSHFRLMRRTRRLAGTTCVHSVRERNFYAGSPLFGLDVTAQHVLPKECRDRSDDEQQASCTPE
jgi:hypothetical protein